MADISKITLPSGNTYNIKDAVARSLISAGITFIVAWDGVSIPVAANIPSGITVSYNGTNTTGTLAVTDGVTGAFYLVKSSTSLTTELLDVYDEYVVIKPVTSDDTTWFWEKIGDTQIDLTNVVTDVTLNKQTSSAIGSNATFKDTQPTIELSTGAAAGAGVVSVATGITSASISGDNVNAVTGYASPTSDTFLKTVTPTTSKLTTTSVTGVNGSTTASKAIAATSQTTVSGSTDSTSNADFLANVSVSNEVLTIGAKKLSTQTTTQFTFNDVTVPKAASSATTVATGAVAAGSTGASIVTGVSAGASATALTALGEPTTDEVLGTSSTITVTPVTTNIKATATGGKTQWNDKDTITVLNNGSSLSVTKGS